MTTTATTPRHRPALLAIYTGLALTVVTTIIPLVGDGLAEHTRDIYPSYSRQQVDSAVGAAAGLLCVVGGLGVLAWLTTAWAAGAGKRWARLLSAALFVIGACVASAELLVTEPSGEPGLPPLVGGLALLPCLAGLAATVLLWRRQS